MRRRDGFTWPLKVAMPRGRVRAIVISLAGRAAVARGIDGRQRYSTVAGVIAIDPQFAGGGIDDRVFAVGVESHLLSPCPQFGLRIALGVGSALEGGEGFRAGAADPLAVGDGAGGADVEVAVAVPIRRGAARRGC